MSEQELSATAKSQIGQGDRSEKMSVIFQALGMLPVLIAVSAAFAFISDRFLSVGNLMIVMQQASINLVLACGMTLVILTAGIDLSVGSVLAASAIAALIVSLDPTFSQLAIPAALACGLGFGLINGILIAFARLPPFIVTLGGLTAIRGIARLMGNDTTVFNSNLPYAIIGNGSFFGIPILVIIALAMVLVTWFILRRTVLGVHIYAIGGNPNAARLTGIKVNWVLIFVYAASGLLAGLGGVMASASCMPQTAFSLAKPMSSMRSPPSFSVERRSLAVSAPSGARLSAR